MRSFQASDTHGASITHLRQIPDTPYLVSLSEDLSSEPSLRVWALDKIDKKTGGPKCLSTVNVQNGRRQFPISAYVILDDLSQVAVGFANGSVTVIRGDLIHDRGTKQRTVYESEDPITALAIRQGTTKILYIATTGKISSLVIAGTGQGQPIRTVDKQGCGVGCMTQDPGTGDILVARDDAIYYYGPRGRGSSYAFDGPKKLIKVFREYVGLVCPPRVAQVSKTRNFRKLGADEVDDIFSSSSFTLLDTDLKYVAHTESLATQVKEIFVEWGELFLLTQDGKLFRYKEKTLQQKLEILYQRNLYIYAINLAQKLGADKIQQNIIFRKYGDYLYQRGDYDTAMQQYLRAIDNTEPSQVIRKFLDTQRIHNLIDYLEELHEHDKATTDHTTLLLNCYAKLKDTEKLDAFIRSPGDTKFDLDTAISMCRQGGYYDQAAYLATKHGENELVIDILIEDSKKYAEALQFIWRLPAEAAYPVLMKYARSLVDHCPGEATQLFIDYYTGQYQPKKDVPAVADVQAQSSGGAFQNLSALWTLPFMVRPTVGTRQPTVAAAVPDEQGAEATEEERPPAYTVPRPRTAFSSFIGHPREFLGFLKAIATQPNLSKADQSDVSTTLFEIYLELANSSSDRPEKESLQRKAQNLITSGNADALPIDTSNVLLLSSLTNFLTGTTLVREKADLYPDIFRSYTSAKDTSGAISALRKYGAKDLSLYPLALIYFSSSAKVLEEPGVKDEVQKILLKIDQENLMAPLQVIKVLSQGGAVTMGMIKDYLADNISRERKDINNNRKLIESYRTETATKTAEIEDLGTKPVVFQNRRCSSCGRNLDLPVVHFMCKHSFHQQCLNRTSMDSEGEDKTECPICKPGNDTIKAIRRQQVESTEQHALFEAALSRSTNRFGTISEFFGRGVMSTAPVND